MEVQPHPFLLGVSRALLEKADRSLGEANSRLKLTALNAAPIFQAIDAEGMRLYELLLGELVHTGWVRLVLKKPREFQTFVEREPTLELLDFSSLAKWAGYQSRHEAWDRRFVAHLRSEPVLARFGAAGPTLADYIARSPLWALEPLGLNDATAVLERLHRECLAGAPVPLRQLSASLFQGRSKVLDNRTELLRLLAAGREQFPEAPIQLLASVPPQVTEVIFVENLMTYEEMCAKRKQEWAQALLLYAAGFRGGAKRLLEPGSAVLYLRQGSASAATQVAQSFLSAPESLPVFFFGDLDFSGMEILRNLRQVFPQAEAWQPGYIRLLDVLSLNGGHKPDWAGKEGQVDPEVTGCDWADSVLLPAMRQSTCFVDQEAVNWI